MPKRTIDFNVPVNVLIRDDGTKEALIAIAYFRGEGSSFAGPVRDALATYVREWIARLTPSERKRFDEILASVKTSEAMRKAIRADTPRKLRRKSTHSLKA